MTAPTQAGLAPAAQALLSRLESAGLSQLRVAWADLHGSYRTKTLVLGGPLGLAPLASALAGGIGMVSTLLLKDSADRTALPVFEPGALDGLEGFGAANNLVLVPVPESFCVLPWAPDTGWLRAEPRTAGGEPVAVDPRQVLERALARLAAQGLRLQVGLEIEFHVWRLAETTQDLAADQPEWPAEAPAVRALHPGHGLLSEAWADRCHAVLALVRETALGLGLPLVSLEIEFGPSQFEAVFAPGDALLAADRLLAFRNGVRQALARAGYHASFIARPPFAGAMASGWHLHQSLVDADGRNVFVRTAGEGAAGAAADEARSVLSDTGAHWLAGLLAHAPGLAALSVPTANGYARFHGSPMAPGGVHWGFDHRGAMLRVLGRPGDAATRIENRLGEPLANPYLCLAGQVLAGLDGLARRLEPGPAVRAAYAAPAEGTARLPARLEDALAALAADPVLAEGLGAPMLRVYQAVRQAEAARRSQARDADDWDRRELFARF